MNTKFLQELYKTRQLKGVDKAYVTADFKRVVIELAKAQSAQTMYFAYEGFQAR